MVQRDANGDAVFTSEMRKTHTILVPMMLPIHFSMVVEIMQSSGYHIEILKTTDRRVIDEGLQSVHNDICYPALLVIGQMIDALKSGNYDPDKTALMITQTGGGCRASNYIFLLRKALRNSGFENVPVISLNLSGLESCSGFRFTLPMLLKASFALLYGDMLMVLANQCRPYEYVNGDTQRVVDHWTKELSRQFKHMQFLRVKKNYKRILADFDTIKRNKTPKIKVGIVGEIYMKYSPLGNSCLEDFLISEDAEPVVSGVMDFLLYCFTNSFIDNELYGRNKQLILPLRIVVAYLLHRQKQTIRAIQKHGVFTPPTEFKELLTLVDGTIGKGAKMGEGWLLTAEMLELIHSGVNNIVCTQPFGCLPNHIVAKGMMRKIKDAHPNANIVAIDYDPSATQINQENRLKLMLANARITQEAKEEKSPLPSPAVSNTNEEVYV